MSYATRQIVSITKNTMHHVARWHGQPCAFVENRCSWSWAWVSWDSTMHIARMHNYRSQTPGSGHSLDVIEIDDYTISY
jgi:hypothetical protein